ncbi:Domain of uncharacterised function (DUF2825) [Bordetella ansorpii]|uniref:Domain of uncharacterized function (DUF2825) n=1 Tax=Bordetella ansorpii TaxID=288768 RepID=A0A157QTS9_9BORD|nr:Domain of uncharacterised function (DUF2825) [Bordetella ansorpii]
MASISSSLGPAGSSPHTRGTQLKADLWRQAMRFIPAYAGNTVVIRISLCAPPVHPRIRGEHASSACSRVACVGSSPHTRGTPWPFSWQSWGSRFIPAYAGNTDASASTYWRTSVHPRIRGEHEYPSERTVRTVGSSPHTRGTRAGGCRPAAVDRFIPAYAGNTRTWRLPRRSPPVHPRIRGEHAAAANASAWPAGSSPHTRGTLQTKRRHEVAHRFIPAYAGNTWCYPPVQSQRAVHPRIRGEHPVSICSNALRRGSSPHTRGTRLGADDVEPCGRFIPAYAGNTLSITHCLISEFPDTKNLPIFPAKIWQHQPPIRQLFTKRKTLRPPAPPCAAPPSPTPPDLSPHPHAQPPRSGCRARHSPSATAYSPLPLPPAPAARPSTPTGP